MEKTTVSEGGVNVVKVSFEDGSVIFCDSVIEAMVACLGRKLASFSITRDFDPVAD